MKLFVRSNHLAVATIVLSVTISSLLIPLFLGLVVNSVNHNEKSSLGQIAKFAFAANEGLLRCTNGKLATTQDQCPPTDQCPPPQNTTVTDCIPGQSPNSKLSTSNQQDKTDNQTMIESHCYENRATFHTPQCPVNATSSVNSTSIANNTSSENSTATDNNPPGE